MNEIDKLRQLCKEAKIPIESYKKRTPECLIIERDETFYDKDHKNYWYRNQVAYGSNPIGFGWVFDAIYSHGSYSGKKYLETYGSLGTDEDGEPMLMTAKECFQIIEADYKQGFIEACKIRDKIREKQVERDRDI